MIRLHYRSYYTSSYALDRDKVVGQVKRKLWGQVRRRPSSHLYCNLLLDSITRSYSYIFRST